MIFGRKQRLALTGALALALAPGQWVRTAVADRNSADISITSVPFAPAEADANGFTVEGLWQLSALSENFGGYSAIAALYDGTLRLYSDKGWLLTFKAPDMAFDGFTLRQLYPQGRPLADLRDMEAATYNFQTGQYWIGYENVNMIHRFAVDGNPEGGVQPEFTRQWGVNSGMEALVRLADGRFIVLRENMPEGYLYDGDPVEGAAPMPFRTVYPDGFEATDMAQLPDGRVLVLMRRLGWHIPPFESLLMIGDPDLIDGEGVWELAELARLDDLLPHDNYEGVAIRPRADGSVTLWFVSDDNKSALQRSLLAKLHWDMGAQSAESIRLPVEQ